jgi:hypothetical protein
MPSDRKVTCEVKLALLHLNHGLLVMIALGYSRVQSLLLGLDPHRVWALIGIMPWLPTIVANAGWKFLGIGDLWLSLTILKISRRLIGDEVILQWPDADDWEEPCAFFLTKRNFLPDPFPDAKSFCLFFSSVPSSWHPLER